MFKISHFTCLQIILVLLSNIFFSCKHNSSNIEEIYSLSQNNKPEIEKTLNYFKDKNEKLKLKATLYLLNNMTDKYGRYGSIVQKYYPVFKLLDSLMILKLDSDTINKQIKSEWEKIERSNGPITIDNCSVLYDLKIVKSEFLIENIEYAFKAWKEMAWSKHFNFDQFCEFILPYRLLDEPIQPFRKEILDEFSWIADSMNDRSNPIEVCQIVSDYVSKKFNFCSQLDKCPLLGVNDLIQLHGGICEHRYLLVASILRSLGVPISIDYAIQFNNNAIGHSWLVTIDKSGKFIPFNAGEPGIIIRDTTKFPIIGVYGATKVFRYSFANQSNKIYEKDYNRLIPVFQDKHISDVSSQYLYPQRNISIQITKPCKSDQFIYLCSFGYGEDFSPIYYSKQRFREVNFKSIGSNCAYFIANINKENKYNILSNPIYLKNDDKYVLNPNLNKTISVKLTRKFLPLQYYFRMYEYANWLKGAKFQASTDKQFSKPITIYEIDRNDYLSYCEKEITLNKMYRYFRFISSDTGLIRIAEVGFEGKNLHSTNKNIYGYFNSNVKSDNTRNFENAFDKDISTNFNAPAGSWIAIDFGIPVTIDKIYFLIRNDLNAIELGDTYELYYFNYGWQSLGKQIASKFYLIYNNVPENALLLLRDLSQGHEERIFIYCNGNQIWL